MGAARGRRGRGWWDDLKGAASGAFDKAKEYVSANSGKLIKQAKNLAKKHKIGSKIARAVAGDTAGDFVESKGYGFSHGRRLYHPKRAHGHVQRHIM